MSAENLDVKKVITFPCEQEVGNVQILLIKIVALRKGFFSWTRFSTEGHD